MGRKQKNKQKHKKREPGISPRLSEMKGCDNIATAVYCKNCVHHAECNAKRKEYGIRTFVEGLVDCDGYAEGEIYSGEIVREEQYTEYTEWYWGDAEYKHRCRDVLTYRKFFTDPKPPVTDQHFIVRPIGEDATIECYSTGECLIAIEPKKKTETRYFPSWFDRVRDMVSEIERKRVK